MRVAILESIIMPAGHEVEFDRILVNEMKAQGHEPMFFVPEKFPFKVDYGVPIHELEGGEVVTYAGANKLQKIWRSILREKRRRAWFSSAAKLAKKGACDAIIIPTATHRYIKAILGSGLKDSSVPVYIIFHGINPKEQPKFEAAAKKIASYKNIHLKVISLRDDVGHLPNVEVIPPPVFTPVYERNIPQHEGIKLGFFGQFRKEKNLEVFLEAFKDCQFKVPVELVVQGATAKPEDGELFEAIIKKYNDVENIQFIHKSLIGKDWEEALLSVDGIIMPYGAERYRYHWGAMLFTAIGYNKPVVVSPELNPEVLEQFKIGKVLTSVEPKSIKDCLEDFVAYISEDKEALSKELGRANEVYSHRALIHNLLGEVKS